MAGSGGLSGTIAGLGDPSLAANAFSVSLANLPPNRPGLLLVGTARIHRDSPFRQRLLFIGGNVLPVATSNTAGQAAVPLDFTQPPLAGAVPGSTLCFRLRFEDAVLPGATNALEVVFCD